MAGPTATLASASFACTPVKRFEFFPRTSEDIQCTGNERRIHAASGLFVLGLVVLGLGRDCVGSHTSR